MAHGNATVTLDCLHSIFKSRTVNRTTDDGVGKPSALDLGIIELTMNRYTVYTCQKSQPRRCKFFLWDDEAKPREAAALMNNSRTEPTSSPQTPSKTRPDVLITPKTSNRRRDSNPEAGSPRTPSNTSYHTPSSSACGTETETATTQGSGSVEEELFDWPASDDDELSRAADQASSEHPMPLPETPHKAIKADLLSTPGKRRYAEMAADEKDALRAAPQTPATEMARGDIFTTPATRCKGLFAGGGLPSPAETPTPIRYKDLPPSQDSELASDVLMALRNHDASITSEAREALKKICNRHVLHTRGIMKGRDVSRAMVKSKVNQVTELQEEIEGLKAERETNRALISQLVRDMARKESGN